MSKSAKIILYASLAVLTAGFGYLFTSHYNQYMRQQETGGDQDQAAHVNERSQARMTSGSATDHHLGYYGGGLVLSTLFLGLLLAHDLSVFFAGRAVKTLFNEEGEALLNPQYDQAEDEWANGNHLEAVRLMREALQANPKEIHIAIRIAEIYEKDLKNDLAAALEYEEILTSKLSPDRWAWTAIHLCNIYSRMNQPDKVIALLRRIESEYGETAAAEKARARLASIEEGESGAVTEAAPEENTNNPQAS